MVCESMEELRRGLGEEMGDVLVCSSGTGGGREGGWFGRLIDV